MARCGARERPVDRERAGDVGRELPVLGPGIDEDQIAILHLPTVLGVVENAGVGARPDDGGIAIPGRTHLAEHVFEDRLGLILEHPRGTEPHRFLVGLGRDAAGLGQPLGLRRRLDEPHVVQDRGRVLDDRRHRPSVADPLVADVLQQLDDRVVESGLPRA